MMQAGAVKLLLAAEMIGDAGDIDARRLGDLADRGRVVALSAEALNCRGNELLAGAPGRLVFAWAFHGVSIKRLIE
jgi:hypothetical protein